MGLGRVAFGATSMLVLSACTLLVSTSGLSDPQGTPAPDGGKTETGAPPSDGGADGAVVGNDGGGADSAVDAGSPCPGRFATAGWGSFGPEPGASVVISGDRLTATVTTNAVGASGSAVATYFTESLSPKMLHVAYDLEVRPNPTMYFEPGCSVFLLGPTETLARHIPGVNGTDLIDYVNVYKTGPDDDRQRVVSTIPNTTSKHHIDVTFTVTGKNAVVDTDIDGSKRRWDGITLDAIPRGFFVNCGIPFSSQTSGGNGSVTVDVSALSLSACP